MTDVPLGRENLSVFADTLLELASQDPSIMVVTSDSRGSGKLVPFGQELPEQIVEMGIAEQNLVGVAAGLAMTGKKIFVVSPACFLTARSLEQIKNDVAYSDHPVKLIGISAGVSYGALGTTHHSLHDYAVMRAINNIDIVAPADNFEAREVIKAAVFHPRPIYVRYGKKPMLDLPRADTQFKIGKSITLLEGNDITFIATGEPTERAYLAAKQLEAEGLSCRVMSMHTVKPLDLEALLHAASNTRVLITVEEHSVNGGLGEACATILMQHGIYPTFKVVAIPDEYTVTGNQLQIFDYYGISADGLAETARQLLNRSTSDLHRIQNKI